MNGDGERVLQEWLAADRRKRRVREAWLWLGLAFIIGAGLYPTVMFGTIG